VSQRTAGEVSLLTNYTRCMHHATATIRQPLCVRRCALDRVAAAWEDARCVPRAADCHGSVVTWTEVSDCFRACAADVRPSVAAGGALAVVLRGLWPLGAEARPAALVALADTWHRRADALASALARALGKTHVLLSACVVMGRASGGSVVRRRELHGTAPPPPVLQTAAAWRARVRAGPSSTRVTHVLLIHNETTAWARHLA